MKRIPQLDILRAFAILLVIGFHAEIPVLKDIGWIGVDLFFVLSGFLISGLLFSELQSSDSIDCKRFWIRRGLKIYPAYLFMIVVVRLFDPRPVSYLSEFTFIQNYHRHPWFHTWSLALEEHFYLLFPLLLLWLARRRRLHLIPYIGCVLLVNCLALRSWTVWAGYSLNLAYTATHSRIDALFAGVVLGYLFHYRPAAIRKFSSWPVFAFFLVLLVPCSVFAHNPSLLCSVGLTSNFLAFTLLVGWSVQQPWLRSRLLQRIGADSYSIYLWHLPLIVAIGSLSHPILSWIAFPICLLVGMTVAEAVEIPVLEIRNRWFPTKIVARPELPHPQQSRAAHA